MTIHNPYFAEVAGGVTVGLERAGWSDRHIDVLDRREDLVREYAWAIPNEEAIYTIAAESPILEVGCGTGYWAWLVEQANGDIVATEKAPPGADTWTTIIVSDAVDAIDRWGDDRTLFLCWPTVHDSWAADALDAYDGDTVVYVGEGRTGVNADYEFHERLVSGFYLRNVVSIPTYLTTRDRLEVWTR